MPEYFPRPLSQLLMIRMLRLLSQRLSWRVRKTQWQKR
jgi:hypothetical protein